MSSHTGEIELKKQIQDRLNNLTKPIRSLGILEDIVLQYCVARGNPDARIKTKKLFVFAGDHGIAKEGGTPYPSEVTRQMVLNMVNGGAAISVICKNAGIECRVVDIGVNCDFGRAPEILHAKVRPGTQSFLHEPAMTMGECLAAIEKGRDLGRNCKADLAAAGEMGIGNSSAASALYSLLLNRPAKDTVGRGTGAEGAILERKGAIISQAVEFHRREWDQSPMDALRRVGGFEIAAIAGFYLGAAESRIPVVVDGFIAGAAALVALKMNPSLKPFLFFGHVSKEKFHRDLLEELACRPILDLDMCLGEGTGAALAMQVMEQALNCYHQMATFQSAGVSDKK